MPQTKSSFYKMVTPDSGSCKILQNLFGFFSGLSPFHATERPRLSYAQLIAEALFHAPNKMLPFPKVWIIKRIDWPKNVIVL